MQFLHPELLAAGLIACIITGAAFYRSTVSRRRDLGKLVSAHMAEQLTATLSGRRRLLKQVMIILAIACIFTALARPRAGYRWEETRRKGIDILMALDTSRSMLAEDIRPNRLERSKLGIHDFVSKLNGDRVGLIAFAGTSFLMCPLTVDYDAFSQTLDAVHAGIIPRSGTDIAGAIEKAASVFEANANHKILLLVTDGEDLEGEALSAAGSAAEKGMTIYTVGVGTPSGELVPAGASDSGPFVKDENGRIVKSRLDEDMLKRIAAAAGGIYRPLGSNAQGFDDIYKEKLSRIPEEEHAGRMRKVPIERFQWPLALGTLLLLLEHIIPERKFSGKRRPGSIRTQRERPAALFKKILAVICILSAATALLLFLNLKEASAFSGGAQKAYDKYEKKEYAEAAEEYAKQTEKKPENRQLRFNRGAAEYKAGNYDAALESFENVLGGKDSSVHAKAFYNTGNTLYRMGEKTESSDTQNTVMKWEKALDAYKRALELNETDENARFNHDFVARRLENLKKQQKQKNSENSEGKKEDKSGANNKKKSAEKNRSSAKETGASENNEKSNPNRNEKSADTNADKNQETGPDSSGGVSPESPGQKNQADNPAGSATGSKDPKAAPGPEGKTPYAQAPVKNGAMTRLQAENLLDSLKNEPHGMLFMQKNGEPDRSGSSENRRNW